MKKILRALISVSDKKNIIELATLLKKHNVEILSTGGTAKLFIENDIPVIEVSEYTDYPEMLGGRVKTLHPKIHGGILGKRNDKNHIKTMKQNNINEIDLVIVNLYPFQSAIQQENCTLDLAIENIDIGGPTMIRAAAKNYISVAVVTDPNDYEDFSKEFTRGNGSISNEYKFKLNETSFNGYTSWRAVGIWETINKKESKGGPFCSYLFFNKILNKTFHINYLLHNPGKDKSIHMRQMDLIIKSFTISPS